MAVWSLSERRRRKRYSVDWTGSLDCSFQNHEESLRVKVAEISCTGAKLVMERLMAGSYHIAIKGEHSQMALCMEMPEGTFVTPVEILWFNMDSETRLFSVGVSFSDLSADCLTALDRVVKTLK
jgi:c-di-GMP-binding flagellar brake protein YcgR